MYSSQFVGLVLTIAGSGIAATLGAGPRLPIVSDFDDGPQGWSVSGIATQWMATDGNPDGFVRGQGTEAEDPPVILPPKAYLGNWLELDGAAELRFDHRVIDAGAKFCRPDQGQNQPYRVELFGPGGHAVWTGAFPPQEAGPWITVHVPIQEAAWTVTEGSWTALLGDVSDFRIEMELFCNQFAPDDVSGLDNIGLFHTCPADFNGDSTVDSADLAVLLAAWGPCADCLVDLNHDGDVGASDLAVVLADWGPCER